MWRASGALGTGTLRRSVARHLPWPATSGRAWRRDRRSARCCRLARGRAGGFAMRTIGTFAVGLALVSGSHARPGADRGHPRGHQRAGRDRRHAGSERHRGDPAHPHARAGCQHLRGPAAGISAGGRRGAGPAICGAGCPGVDDAARDHDHHAHCRPGAGAQPHRHHPERDPHGSPRRRRAPSVKPRRLRCPTRPWCSARRSAR